MNSASSLSQKTTLPSSIRSVIFDLDGTILNTLTDLTSSVNYALSLHHLPLKTEADVRAFLGNGMERLIRLSMDLPVDGSKDSDLYRTIYQEFRAHYALHSMDFTAPYEGIPKLLHALKAEGYLLAVVSNKGDAAVQPLIASCFPSLFDFACGEKEGVRRKPAPDTVNECLQYLGVPARKAIYIGDSEVDIETAKNARMPCISVTWGFRDEAQLLSSGASLFARTPGEILSLIKGN